MTGIHLVDFKAEEYRERLAKMSDERLIKEGEAAAYMTNAKPQFRINPAFAIQLRECRAEWRRRHPRPR
jgi:hypothetical protein